MRYIDEDKIYDATDGGKSVFAHYFPGYEFGNRKAYVKVRSSEKTPSAVISLYNGLWRITDFGNQQELSSKPAVAFVMWREAVNYYEALLFIEEVILRRTVDDSKWMRPRWTPEYESREMTPDDKTGEYHFVYKESNEITDKDLQAIGRYITKDLLDRYCCRVLKYYEYCSFSKAKNRTVVHKFIATDDYPIFVFDYGDFKKIYRPHDMEKKNRFLYVGNKPRKFVYGYRQLIGTSNEFISMDGNDDDPPKDKPKAIVRDLYRCSGESDALNLASLGYHVYWLNSETADMSYEEYREIDDLCENHYQIMDLDVTGQQMAMKNALKYIDFLSVEMPEWLTLKKDFRGNPCKDLKDFINLTGESVDDTRSQFNYRRAKARKVKFWYRDDKGNYGINMEYYYFFLKANGFYQMEYKHMKNSDYCYAWIRGKIVDLIPPEGVKRIVKRFTKDWIKRKNLIDEIPILNKLNTSAQISEANIDTMDNININFKNVTREYEYIHFRNASLRISKEKIERVKHEDIPNNILGSITVKNEAISHVVDKNISLLNEPPAIEINPTAEYKSLMDRLASASSDIERQALNVEISQLAQVDRYDVAINDEHFIFTTFLRDITRMHWRKNLEYKEELSETEQKEEKLALANVMFCIGYLCAQYKNQGKPWIVFIQDMKISQVGQSSGRSGKSLVSKALGYVRKQFYIEGRKLDDKGMFQFIYDGLTEFHDIIEVDDLAEFGDFTFFYTQTTGKRTVNSKHTSPFVLEYEDSGKMIISSNFELPNTDSSTMARLLNCGVSDYYHEQTKFNDYIESRSPLSKFGRELYTDFTDEEWVKFYNFIAYCIQVQMRFDKIQPPMENIERRQLRRQMSEGLGREENFLKWADDYFQHWNSTEMRPTYSPPDGECAYLNTYFDRSAALLHFFENSGISENRRKAYNAQRFRTHIENWAQYQGYELNPENMCSASDKKRILKKFEGKTREYFFIKSPDVEVCTSFAEEIINPNLPF